MFSLFFNYSSNHANPQSYQRGFGLIELLVSISIMVIVTAVVIVRQNSFNSSVLLRSQAYEIALELRNVQLNAVSASGDTGSFREELGVYFNTGSMTDNTYRIFRDSTTGLNDDSYYNVTEEFGLQGFVDPRFEILEVRAVGDTIDGGAVAVVFERPNFDARFFDINGEVAASSIEIDVALRTDNSQFRTIEITAAGQISVN